MIEFRLPLVVFVLIVVKESPQVTRILSIATLLGSLVVAAVLRGEETPEPFRQPRYTIYRTDTPIRIDGILEETAWQSAPQISDFHFTWYKSGQKEHSVAKILWDDKYLYVGHTCEDAWITARCTEHDGPVARDDCFEVMVAPNTARPNVYFNIEWNVLGAWVDNHRPNGPQKPRAPKWDATGVTIAGRYVGTLNDDSDKDQGWTAEVAIPFSNFFQGGRAHTA